MNIIRKRAQLSNAINALKNEGKTVALVPTMGALHDGHISLVKRAKTLADRVVVSIFVNPTQFGKNEDFSRYPRDERADTALLARCGACIVYIPAVEEIYPEGQATDIRATHNADILCGHSRQGHFDGVVTVVKRLFEHIKPDFAVFGEKDYQQLHIIIWLVNQYDIPVKIIGSPVIREEDGLALSSRNRYLDRKERETAPLLYRTLTEVWDRLNHGDSIASALTWGKSRLEEQGFTVDYLELRNAETLAEVKTLSGCPARLLVAVWLGKTRLIDNIPVM